MNEVPDAERQSMYYHGDRGNEKNEKMLDEPCDLRKKFDMPDNMYILPL
jgi:hypothetical protein